MEHIRFALLFLLAGFCGGFIVKPFYQDCASLKRPDTTVVVLAIGFVAFMLLKPEEFTTLPESWMVEVTAAVIGVVLGLLCSRFGKDWGHELGKRLGF